MKRILIFFFALLFLALPAISTAQIKAATLEETSDNDIVRERIVDKAVEPYVREREVIIQQLEIITGDEENKYIIIPGDTLDISYQDRSEVKKAVYQVSGEGKIRMPLIGEVKISDMNRKDARKRLNMMLGEYIRHPNVEIAVNVSGRYMVSGEVEDPGVFRLRPNLTVMEAILTAGYDKDEVNLKSVIVMRGGVGDPIAKRLDLHKMITKGDRSDNILVKPGDFIYVSKKFIGNVEQFISTVYRYVKAYYGLGRIPGEPVQSGGEPDTILYE